METNLFQSLPRFLIEPEDVYRAQSARYLTSHQLRDYAHNPRKHQLSRAGLLPVVVEDFYREGSALHCMVLEGLDRFHESYIVGGPINPRTDKTYGEDTKAYAEWAEQQTKKVLSESQYALCVRMADSVLAHRRAGALLAEPGITEGVLRSPIEGVECQGRLDRFTAASGILDVKTCANLDQFLEDVERYGYVEQMAFYGVLVANATGSPAAATLIAVEKEPPYRCGVWGIAPHKIKAAARNNAAWIREYRASLEFDFWPTHYEQQRWIA